MKGAYCAPSESGRERLIEQGKSFNAETQRRREKLLRQIKSFNTRRRKNQTTSKLASGVRRHDKPLREMLKREVA